jgi:hypothetical protein
MIHQDILRDVETNVTESRQFSISHDSAKLFSMLSSSLYSDKEKAVCYELGANCYDANPEVPFMVVFPTKLDAHIRFRDYGPGLSEDNVYRLLTVYGASDKHNDPNKIGGYGIGAKSPAAVASTWNVISHHAGLGMEFLVFIDDHGIPSLTKIREWASEETGLEVIIPVQPSRFFAWEQALRTCFKHYPKHPTFKNIAISYKDCVVSLSGPKWKMIKGSYDNLTLIASHRLYDVDHAKLTTELGNDRELVAYCRLPIILEFGHSDLSLSLSREQIQYTKATIQNIKRSLEVARTEIKKIISDKLATATNGLEYREKLAELWNDFSGNSKTCEVEEILQPFIDNNNFGISSGNVRNVINNYIIRIGEYKTTGSWINTDVFNAKVIGNFKASVVFKDGFAQKVTSSFTCRQTRIISLRTDRHHDTSTNLYTHSAHIRFGIDNIKDIAFYLNDVLDSVARIKYNRYTITEKYVLVLNENIVPAELKSRVKLASSLPKVPRTRTVRSTKNNTSKIESTWYRRTGAKLEKVSASDYAHNMKLAYFVFTNASTTMSIKEEASFLEAANALGYTLIGFKENNIDSSVSYIKDVVAKEFDTINTVDTANKINILDALIKAKYGHYSDLKLRFFKPLKGIVLPNTVWETTKNTINDALSVSLNIKMFLELASTLLRKPLLTPSITFDKICQEFYDTYPMLKYVDIYSVSNPECKVQVEKYLKLCEV